MAATCIMSIHINKGKTARQCIGERLDYIMNPKKTDDGILHVHIKPSCVMPSRSMIRTQSGIETFPDCVIGHTVRCHGN